MFSRRTTVVILICAITACSTRQQPDKDVSTVTASPESVLADGVTTTTVTVTVRDSGNQPIPGLFVELSATGSGDTLIPTIALTDSNGVVTATLASTRAEEKTVTATFGGVTLSTAVTFTAAAPSATSTTITASPTTVTADGLSTATLTVSVTDSEGNPVSGQHVVLASTGSRNTFGRQAGTTDASGHFISSLASTAAETKTVTAAVAGNSVSASVTFIPGPPSAENSTIIAASPGVIADGSSTDLVTVAVADANGNPIVGASVTLSGSILGDHLTPASGATASDGTLASNFSTAIPATHTITAMVGDQSISTTVTAEAGGFSRTSSSIIATPGSVTADGMSLVTLLIDGRDATGNPLVGAPVTLSGSGSENNFSESTGTLDVNGEFVATLSSTLAQSETITAAIGNPDDTVSTPVTFVPGPGANAVFTTQPMNATAGAPLAHAVVVALEDASGNVIASDSTTAVTITLTNANGAILNGTTSVRASAGVARFTDLAISKAGAGYTLQVAAPGYQGSTSFPFNITAGAMANAVFTVQPSTTAAGKAIGPPVTVTLEDALGNQILSDSSTRVTLALGANPGASTLQGIVTTIAVAGVATFDSLSLRQTGTGYTLTASAPGYSSATSLPFDITPGPMARAAFATQPSSITAGMPFSPAVVVALEDAYDNIIVTDSSTVVTLNLWNPPGNATLQGNTSVTAVSGVATLPGVTVQQAGIGYTMTASAGGYSTATSDRFNVVAGAMGRLVFTTQPSNTVAGQIVTPAVAVTLEDTFGNTILADSSTAVTLSVGTIPNSAALGGTTSVTAVSGVATFPNLRLNTAGSYTLQAAAPGYGGATSSPFSVAPGPPVVAAFSVEPSNAVAGEAIAPAVAVALEDAFGNVVTSDWTSVVTLGLASGSGALLGAVRQTAVGGIATFPDLHIDQAGTFTLSATTTAGYSRATSSPFQIAPAAPVQAVFTQAPSGAIAGATLAPVTVTLEDQFGNAITADSSTAVTVSIEMGGATLNGTTTQIAVNGIATFSDLSIQQAGSWTLSISTTNGYQGGVSAPVTISPAAPSSLAFAASPMNTTAGATLGPVIVKELDQYGNTVTSDSATPIGLTVASGPGSLFGTTSVTAASGVARFSATTLHAAGTYTLAASAPGCQPALSASFAVTAGAKANADFTVGPSNITAGSAFSPTLQVTLEDAFGNPILTDSSTAVAVALNPSSGGATVSGVSTQTANQGVVTFPNLTVNRAGAGYTLVAAASGYVSAMSNAFSVTAGPSARLAFSVQPSTATAGVTIAPAVEVTLEDQFGNSIGTDSTTAVTIGIGSGSGTLVGTTTRSVRNGIATFSDLSLDQAGRFTLIATAGSLTPATSNAFTVLPGSPAQLVFTGQPPNTTAGTPFTTTVALEDAYGNAIGTDSHTVVTLTVSPAAILQGATTVTASNGVAKFVALQINQANTAYALTASANGYGLATSANFSVSPAAKANAVFTGQPSNTSAGVAISPPVVVTLEDIYGNTIDSDSSTVVTVALGNNAGGSTLSGTTAVTANNGVATFAGLKLNRTGTGYTLIASATGYTGATSSAFNVIPGMKSLAIFSVEPTNIVAGTAFSPAVRVTLEDALGNVMTTDSSTTVTLALGTDPTGTVLSGTTSVVASGGVATFPGVGMTRAGSGYTLTATAAGYTSATSTPFNVSPAPGSLIVFTAQPVSQTAGVTLSPVAATLEDAYGNVIPDSSTAVTISIGTNPSSGKLQGTLSVTASNGVATFSDLSIKTAATGYTLRAQATGYTAAFSTPFNIAAAAPLTTAFSVQPQSSPAGTLPAVQVSLEDAYGNVITTDSSTTVGISLGADPTGATLSGQLTATVSSGIASFSSLLLTKAGTGYTLVSTAARYASATSAPFNVVPAAKANAVFSTEPTNATAGVSIAPAVVVSLQDAFGNTITTDSSSVVSVAIGTNPGAGTLLGTVSATASSGLATFSNLTINKAGAGYTLGVSASGYAGTTSTAFNITAGAPSATTSSLTASPASLPPNGSQTTLTATALDAFGNPIAGQTVTFTASGTGNTFIATSCVTGSNGTCWVELSSTVGQTETIFATIGSIQTSTRVSFVITCTRAITSNLLETNPYGTTLTIGYSMVGGGGGAGYGGTAGSRGAVLNGSFTLGAGQMLQVFVGGGGGMGGSCNSPSGGGGGAAGFCGGGGGGAGYAYNSFSQSYTYGGGGGGGGSSQITAGNYPIGPAAGGSGGASWGNLAGGGGGGAAYAGNGGAGGGSNGISIQGGNGYAYYPANPGSGSAGGNSNVDGNNGGYCNGSGGGSFGSGGGGLTTGIDATAWSTATTLPSNAGAGGTGASGGNAGLVILTYTATSCRL